MITDDSAQYHQWYNDINTVKKMMLENVGTLCPTCCTPFDKGKHRKLIDTCGHELCYMCINSDHCPLCVYHAQAQSQHRLTQDNGIPRPRLKTNGHFTAYMQTRERVSPERPLPGANLPPKVKPPVPERTVSGYSPRISRASRNHRQMKWPNPLLSDNQAALSDDELHTNSKISSRDHDLYTRLGLLLGDRMPLSGQKPSMGSHNLEESYASISSLTSSEANTTNTSPLSTLTDSSDIDPLSCSGGLRTNSRDQSSDSVMSLMSTSTGHSSCSSPIGMQFQRHAPARTSDSFVQFAKRNLNRRQMHHKSDESALNFSALGRKSSTAKLLNKTLKPLYFEVPQAEPDPLFLGRQWLFKEIEQDLITDSKGKRAIVITGGPGSGKTAIVSQLIEYSSFRVKKEDAIYHDIQSLDGSDYNMSNSSSSDSGLYQSISTLHHSGARSLGNRVVAYHLCQTDNNITCLVPEFVHSIAAHLCRAPQLAAYRDLVARDQRLQDLLSMPSCIADVNAAFRLGILEPLSNLRSKNKIPNTTCLLVIDGLNEAEYHRPDYGDSIASFLIRHFEAFPPWLKLFVTIRTSYGEIVKKLPSHYISLDKGSSSENIQKDLCTYIMHRINTSSSIRANITVNNSKVEGSSTSKFASHLANLSKGCILYIRLTLDLIEKGHLVVKSSSYRVLPVSLSEVYTLSFNLKFTTIKSYERVSAILQICLASLYPLTLQELFNTLNAKCVSNGISWEEFMIRMDVLTTCHFLVTRQDGTVMFVHPSMREWLCKREENESQKFLCDPRLGSAAIAFRISRSSQPKSQDDCIELGHHVLRAHIYKTTPKEYLHGCLPRDLQAYWINLGTNCIESSLGSLRNIYSPNVLVSRLLLLAGASPNYLVPTLDNMPILAVAAQHGFLGMVSLLLEFGAKVNTVSNSGVGALTLACQRGFLDIVTLLVANGAKVNQLDDEGKCPAVHAASKGHLDVLMYLFQCEWPSEPGCGPTLIQAAQCSLVAAAFNGHHNVCEYLLDMPDVRVSELDSLTGHSPLTAASTAGHIQCCNVLLRRGASVTAINRQKDSPLLCAAAEGHWEVVEKLLMHGASLEQADSSGRTPLMLAAMSGRPVLELLLSKGASVDMKDKEGLTALSWACLKGHLQAVQCLLSHGSDPNSTDDSGRTPLDFAAFHGDPEIVQLLMDSGALCEHVDVTGMRPLDRAIACKNAGAVAKFLHKGSKISNQTWTMAQGNSEIIILLLNKLLGDATQLCKKGQLRESQHRYLYALKKFPAENTVGLDRRFHQLKYQLLLGLSRCRRKLNEPKLAIEAAEQAIAMKPNSFEGYYARGRAREALGLHENALTDIMEALRVAPQNQELRSVLMRLKEQISGSEKDSYCDNSRKESSYGFSGPDLPTMGNFGSTETLDQLCNMTLNIAEDLNHLLQKDRMQDSGCESIH
ncbi:protein TANC2-like isoform X2 [Argiope bruennichi]|uniref:protein TANC2-like isoform X2 n=1 Tax=Argiope bruennichi TaxID=94029 RepID=UPI00249489D0|nr:protein TANC2-like isoform X2 [Argiope bruennichi]